MILFLEIQTSIYRNLLILINQTEFWANTPWGDGKEKYRLGLKPISLQEWFEGPPDEELLKHKTNLLQNNYKEVVQTEKGSEQAQEILADVLGVENSYYPDFIADCSLKVQDDLCLIESNTPQKLLAASVCSPSYWNLKDKIGKSLRDVHKPVKTLNKKIGDPIEKFISKSPKLKPFVRQNWFIHQDTIRLHLKEEKISNLNPEDWFIRSERETICKIHEEYSLFSINVRFQPLKLVHQYRSQKDALLKSIISLDEEETKYFGGEEKRTLLVEYLERT